VNLAGVRIDLDHNDTGALIIVDRFHPEAQAEVNDRDDLAAQVDHPLNELGCLGDRRDAHHADDFLDLQNTDAIFLPVERKSQVLAFPVGHLFDCLVHHLQIFSHGFALSLLFSGTSSCVWGVEVLPAVSTHCFPSPVVRNDDASRSPIPTDNPQSPTGPPGGNSEKRAQAYPQQ